MSENYPTAPGRPVKSAKPNKPYSEFPRIAHSDGCYARRSAASSTTSGRGPIRRSRVLATSVRSVIRPSRIEQFARELPSASCTLESMSNAILELDGSFGEGGGQILRTSLALSLLTGKAFHLPNVRAGREKPGLQPQHLMSVRSAAAIGGAAAARRGAGQHRPGLRAGAGEAGQVSLRRGHRRRDRAGAAHALPATGLARRRHPAN